MLSWTTAGESHGAAIAVTISGLPANLPIDLAIINHELELRRVCAGRGSRQLFEADKLQVISGMRYGLTLGSPILILIENKEWPKWQEAMHPLKPSVKDTGRAAKLTSPRPGHADLAGIAKYGFTDIRNVLERSSARETAARVVAGGVVQQLLAHFGIYVGALVKSVGDICTPNALLEDFSPLNSSWTADKDAFKLAFRKIDSRTCRSLTDELDNQFSSALKTAQTDAQTLGGEVIGIAQGMPPGFGAYTDPNSRLDAQLAAALMSIPAVKAVEIGYGKRLSSRLGSNAHDAIYPAAEGEKWPQRITNFAGGIEGGISNGQNIVAQASFKPIPSLPYSLPSVDMQTGKASVGINQRSDISAVIPGSVVVKAEMALVLARTLLNKCGGDSLTQTRTNYQAYLSSLEELCP